MIVRMPTKSPVSISVAIQLVVNTFAQKAGKFGATDPSSLVGRIKMSMILVLSLVRELCILKEITVGENNTAYKSIDGNLYSKDGTVLIKYAVGNDAKELIIPEGVTTIGEYAIYGGQYLEKILKK